MPNSSGKKIIGTKYMTYAEKRCLALPFKDYEVRRIIDLYTLITSAHLRIFGRLNFTWFNLHDDFNLSNCLGYHFWNTVSYSSKPWVTTLELPTNDKNRLRLLARKQCKRILCLSSWTLNTQKGFLEEDRTYSSEILPKLDLLYPPQEVKSEAKLRSIDSSEIINFIFVGRDFFRKGGFECVKAFDKVLKDGCDAKLIIVSKLDRNDWPLMATETELNTALAIIETWKNNIHVFREIDRERVMDLISQSHVGLLPTYNDSFGYSVLEFFSHGVPAITTEVLAQSEINHPDRGWLLSLPVNIDKYGVKQFKRDTQQQRQELSQLLTDALYQKICYVLENRHEIEEKREPALQYLKEYHAPDRYQETLEKIYSSFG